VNKSKDQSKLQESKLAPPPKNLPLYGRDKPEFVSYVAWSNYEAALEQKRFLFGVRRRDLRRNTMVIGRPGMGKTKLLQVMARQDIANGYGCCVLDYRGELTKNLIQDIPEERLEDVIIFDPTKDELRIHMNPLEDVSEEFRYPMVRIIEQTLQSMYGELWNPKLEYIVHTTFSTVLSSKEPTLALAYELLTDPTLREQALSTVEDENLKEFWTESYPEWEEKHEADAVLPFINILRNLISHPAVHDVYSTSGSAVDFTELVKEKKIVLVQMRPDRIGDTTATFFGVLVLARYLEQAQARTMQEVNVIRRDYPMYIDEFPRLDHSLLQNFLGAGGSLGLPFVLALNSTTSIDADIAQRLLAKTDNLFCFRLFSEDASRLRSEMLPVFDTRDLQNLGPRDMYCRIVIDNELTIPFSAETLEVHPAPNSLTVDEVIEYVTDQYGLPAQGLY